MRKPSGPVDRFTLVRLSDAREFFRVYFDIPLRHVSSLKRYCAGVTIPLSGEKVRLRAHFSPNRGRAISLDIWERFLDELQAAYERSLDVEINLTPQGNSDE